MAKEISKRVQKKFTKPSLVEQSHQDKTNINSIMRRARRTGMVPVYNGTMTYGDFRGVEDYQTCLNKTRAAERDFMELPAEIRKEFDNDPAKLIGFMGDEKNYDRAVEIGLIEEAEADQPIHVKVMNDELKVGDPEPKGAPQQ